MTQITVYPAYENDQYSQLTQYVYVADWNGLVKSSDLKGYKIINKGSHYYNMRLEVLVDFDRRIEIEEAGNVALRTLAEDEDFLRIAKGKHYRGVSK